MSDYSLAKEIISRAFPAERLIPQFRESWRGEFPLPDEIARYYQNLGPENVIIEGYGNPYFLPSLSGLWEYQGGYRYHPETKESFTGWEDDWLVIADEGADPFIYSRSTGKILHAQHGQGVWEPDEMFTSLEAMVTVLAIIGDVAAKAGNELTGEGSYLREKYVAEARKTISQYLGSEDEAAVLLDSFGWIGHS